MSAPALLPIPTAFSLECCAVAVAPGVEWKAALLNILAGADSAVFQLVGHFPDGSKAATAMRLPMDNGCAFIAKACDNTKAFVSAWIDGALR